MGLKAAIEKGLKEEAYTVTQQLAETQAPLDIINAELIPALNSVGDGFEKGTVFLPQLLMSAEAAKSAFAVLKEKMDKILHVKETTRVDILCGGFPSEFGTFLREARALDFKEEPPYARWRAMFRDLYLRLGYCYDYAFDWTGRFDVVVEDKRADTQPTTARRSREGMREVAEESPLVPQVLAPPPPAETPALLPKRKNIINAIARPNYHLVGKRPGVRVDGRKAGFSKTTVGTARGVPAQRNGKYRLPNPHLSFAE